MLNATARFALTISLVTTFATVAHGQGSEACNPAYEDADALVRSGGDKLLEARDKLRICARPACKAWMVKECTKSLTEVESRIPSVVFVAKDETGADLVEVTITSGDRTLSSRLDGRSIDLGPGEKVFVFALSDGRRVSQKAVIKEGEKAQRVTATFEAAKRVAAVAPPHVAIAPAPAPAPAPSVAEPVQEAPPRAEETQSKGSSLRTVGYVVGGVGIVGLGLGAIFGITAAANKSDANCANNECDPDKLASARSAATVSTIGFVAGGALLAGGVALVLFAPSRSSNAGRLEVTPNLAQREAGLILGGRW